MNELQSKVNLEKVLRYIVLIVLAAMYLFPFYWMITTALKGQTEAMRFPPQLWPSEFHFENFKEAWNSINMLHYLKNSLFVTTCVVVGQLVLSVPAAYAFAKRKFKLKNVLFMIILFDLMVPRMITYLPVYIVMSKVGWIDTYQALIVPYLGSSFAIFFMMQTFKTVPDELVEAAKLDKASELKIMMNIMVPMAKPIILTIATFAFISTWNEYFWPLTFTNSEAVRTLPIAVKGLTGVGDGITPWHIVMAGNVILVSPLLAIYIFASKHIKKAFVYSGIK